MNHLIAEAMCHPINEIKDDCNLLLVLIKRYRCAEEANNKNGCIEVVKDLICCLNGMTENAESLLDEFEDIDDSE